MYSAGTWKHCSCDSCCIEITGTEVYSPDLLLCTRCYDDFPRSEIKRFLSTLIPLFKIDLAALPKFPDHYKKSLLQFSLEYLDIVLHSSLERVYVLPFVFCTFQHPLLMATHETHPSLPHSFSFQESSRSLVFVSQLSPRGLSTE